MAPELRDVCGEISENSATLKTHQRTNTAAGSCSDCPAELDREGDVFSDDHGDEKPHACADCSKRFAHRSKLRVRKRTQTGERPYPCRDCGKAFAREGALTVHQQIHTGEKPYSCCYCPAFRQSDVLKARIRTHTGEKPFVCNGCDQRPPVPAIPLLIKGYTSKINRTQSPGCTLGS